MASLNPSSILNEYTFSEAETVQARLLNPLQKMWLQTKYALYFKEKASGLIPETGDMDRSFFLQQGELQGKLELLQEIFEDCKIAETILANPEKQTEGIEVPKTEVVEIAVLSDRAAQQVHNLD
jgi:hypothetical protein